MTKDKHAVRWIFMQQEGIVFLFFGKGCVFKWVAEQV